MLGNALTAIGVSIMFGGIIEAPSIETRGGISGAGAFDGIASQIPSWASWPWREIQGGNTVWRDAIIGIIGGIIAATTAYA